MSLAQRLRALMRWRGIHSQNQLARISRVPQSCIHRILTREDRYSPSRGTLLRLATALETSVPWLTDGVQDGLDGRFVLRFAGDGAVQVDQMQAARALVKPTGGHGGGVFGEHRCIVQVTLAQAHAAPVFKIDGGDQQHGGQQKRKRG